MAIRGLKIGTGFRDCKPIQEGLKIGAALGISNQGRDCKLGQDGFQIGVKITSRGRN